SDIALSPDDSLIFSGSYDCSIRVWDNKRDELVLVLGKHGRIVNKILLSPLWKHGEKFVASSSDDGMCFVWDFRDFCKNFENGESIFQLSKMARYPIFSYRDNPSKRRKNCISELEWNSNGKEIFCGGNGGILFSLDFDQKYLEDIGDFRHFNDNIDIDIFSKRLKQKFAGPKQTVSSIVYQKYERKEALFTSNHDGKVRIWNRFRPEDEFECSFVFSFRRCFAAKEFQQYKVLSLAFSCDKRKLAFSGTTDLIVVVDVETHKILHRLSGHRQSRNILALAAHPSEPDILFSAGYYGNVVVWDMDTGRQIKLFENRNLDPTNVLDGATSSQGNIFACVSVNGIAQLYGFECKQPYLEVPKIQFFFNDGKHGDEFGD
ncbi:Bromodomain and WD repeat-containing protein 3, partial [Bonamia ostreae]